MTSSTLVSLTSNNSGAPAIASQSASLSDAVVEPTAPRDPASSATMSKLPYQKPQQVELLNLHAEIEALLQQLQVVKQQRLIAAPQSHEPVLSN